MWGRPASQLGPGQVRIGLWITLTLHLYISWWDSHIFQLSPSGNLCPEMEGTTKHRNNGLYKSMAQNTGGLSKTGKCMLNGTTAELSPQRKWKIVAIVSHHLSSQLPTICVNAGSIQITWRYLNFPPVLTFFVHMPLRVFLNGFLIFNLVNICYLLAVVLK